MALFPFLTLTGIFIVTLVIGMAVLRSTSRAFVLAATFSIGATAGFFLGAAAHPLFSAQHGDLEKIYVITFASLASIAGGLASVYLLGKLAGRSLWRRE